MEAAARKPRKYFIHIGLKVGMNQAMAAKDWRPLRLSVVATLVLLSVQGWTGDFVNVFVTTGSVPVGGSISDFFQSVLQGGPILMWHAVEGLLILFLSVFVLAISLRYDRMSVKLSALAGLLSVLSAGVGGFLFVLSGFSNGGNSMQMGGSFIGAYAFYFIVMYCSK